MTRAPGGRRVVAAATSLAGRGQLRADLRADQASGYLRVEASGYLRVERISVSELEHKSDGK